MKKKADNKEPYGVIKRIVEIIPHQNIDGAYYYRFEDGSIERDIRIRGELIYRKHKSGRK